MSKALDGLILKDSTIDIMKDLLRKTKQDRLERGFDLCADISSKELIPRNICTGSACEIEMEGKCNLRKGEKLKGGYHTHRRGGDPLPSLHDLVAGLQLGIECIGAVENDTIKCYVRKQSLTREVYTVMSKATQLTDKFNTGSLTEQEAEKYMELQNVIREKYFRIFNI